MHLSLTANPSHLEAVNPVVLGKVRAKQDQLSDAERVQVMPVLLHGAPLLQGKASWPSVLRCQVCAVTEPVALCTSWSTTRSGSRRRHTSLGLPYPTDNALVVEAPIFHVNGDDPEAVVHAAKVATEFRQKFQKDVVIDIFCYRRFGHNEGDEPMFTNPVMYKRIKTYKTTLSLTQSALSATGSSPKVKSRI